MSLASLTAGFLILAAGFFVLEKLFVGAPHRGRWGRDGRTDLLYWFFTPLVTKTVTRGAVGVAFVLAMAAMGASLDRAAIEASRDRILAGFGPLARQPRWLQAVEVVFLADLIGYWSHRLFHTGRLWPFHAVHHSSEQVDWLSAVRVHPVNDAVSKVFQVVPFLFLGFSPLVVAGFVPVLTLYAILLHANVNWTFGPLRHVLASPVFHRWHHTREADAIDTNFAGMFPVIDIVFGTFYMPRGKVPTDFGVAETLPRSFLGQLAYPFRRRPVVRP